MSIYEVIEVQMIRLSMKVNSENIHVSELKEFIGKRVQMVIIEKPTINKKNDRKMERFFSAAGNVEIDEEVVL